MRELAEGLKKYREGQGLNQEAMAKALGIGYRTYQGIEKTGIVKKIKDIDSINKLLATGKVTTQFIAREASPKYLQDQSSDTISQLIKVLAQNSATMQETAIAIRQHAETINSQQHVIRRYIEKKSPSVTHSPKNGQPSKHPEPMSRVKS